MKIDRAGVEQILDLQVNAGRITPQIKEERLREYDAKVQQMTQQQYGDQMQGPQQYGSQIQGPQQGERGSLDNGQPVRYPYIGKSDTEQYLNGIEMVALLGMVAILLKAVADKSTFMLEFIMGLMFAFVSVKIITKDIEKGRKLSYIPVIAGIVGFGMLGLAFYTKYGSAAFKDSVSAHNDLIGSICIIALGAALIIGNLLSKRNSSKVYTVPVQAVCVELKSPAHGSHVPSKLSPVYEYTYNGVTQRSQVGYFSTKGYPRAGETREIFINPERPGGCLDPVMSKSTSFGLAFLGGFFIVMGVLVLILG